MEDSHDTDLEELDLPQMERSLSCESSFTRVSCEVADARFYALEAMILEERAGREKNIAELRETIAKLQEATAKSGVWNYSDSSVIEESRVRCGGVETEAFEDLKCPVVMQTCNELIVEMREQVASQFHALETQFWAQAKQAAQLNGNVANMRRLCEKVRDVDPGVSETRGQNLGGSKNSGNHTSSESLRGSRTIVVASPRCLPRESWGSQHFRHRLLGFFASAQQPGPLVMARAIRLRSKSSNKQPQMYAMLVRCMLAKATACGLHAQSALCRSAQLQIKRSVRPYAHCGSPSRQPTS